MANRMKTVHTDPLPRVSHSNDAIFGHQLDISSPEKVEVLVRADRKVLWINVDGVCRLRICQITDITWDIGDGNTAIHPIVQD
jgi:hypothetical protein